MNERELLAQRDALMTQARDLNTKAETEARDLTADEENLFLGHAAIKDQVNNTVISRPRLENGFGLISQPFRIPDMFLNQPVEAHPYRDKNAGNHHHQNGRRTFIIADTFHYIASLLGN